MRISTFFFVFLHCFIIDKIQGQTTYTSTPSVGTYVSCPTTETCSGTYEGSVVQMQLTQLNTNGGGNLSFEIKKCNNTTFSGSGTFYIYRYALCNTQIASTSVSSGAISATVSFPFPSGFTTGNITYYGYFHSNASNQDYNAGEIQIIASNPPPAVEFASCINAPSQIDYLDDLNVTYDILSTGPDNWYGTMIVTLSEVGNNANNQVLLNLSTFAFPTTPRTMNTGTDAITLLPGNYRITAIYSNAPSGGYDGVEANGCTPTTTTTTGTITHYKDLTINPPCSEGATINITNPDPGDVFFFSPIQISWSPSSNACPLEISYSVDGGAYQTITELETSATFYNWWINGSINSNNVKIKIAYTIEEVNGNTVEDISSSFAVYTDLYAPNQELPVNNVVFGPGTSSITFEWDRNNPPGAATYELKIRDLTTDMVILDYLNVGDVSNYTHTDLVNFIDGHDYRWVVRAVNPGGTAEQGERYFSIGDFGLELNAPMLFDILPLVESTPDTFTTSVKNLGNSSWSGSFYLRVNNVSNLEDLGPATIPPSQSVDLSYLFTPLQEHAGSNVPVELLYQTDGIGDGYTVPSIFHDNPIYVDILGNSLTLLHPNGGETYQTGDPISGITWSSTGNLSLVSLYLTSTSGTPVDTIAEAIPNNGSFSGNYIIPTSIVQGNYKVLICSNNCSVYDFSDDSFVINNPQSFFLELESGLSINPYPVISGNLATFEAIVHNNGNANFSGDLQLTLIKPDNTEIPLSTETGINIIPNNSFMISHTSNPVISAAGGYQLKAEWRENTNSPWLLVNGNNTYLNPLSFTILDPAGSCDIANPPQGAGEVYDAVQYLCGLGVIDQPNDGNVFPDNLIIKEDLAKITFLPLFNFNPNASTAADFFPVPFGDMQDQENQAYARYGKVLSYLEYGDGISPFYRKFYNYRPASNITRGQVCKVLVEAFNFPKDVSYLPFNDVSKYTS